jgi:hypothetical protein
MIDDEVYHVKSEEVEEIVLLEKICCAVFGQVETEFAGMHHPANGSNNALGMLMVDCSQNLCSICPTWNPELSQYNWPIRVHLCHTQTTGFIEFLNRCRHPAFGEWLELNPHCRHTRLNTDFALANYSKGLDVSGNINATGGTMSGKMLMNGTVVNDCSLQIRNKNCTCPVLCIDSGLSSSQGYQNTNARAIGMPLLGIDGNSFDGVGDYYAIGWVIVFYLPENIVVKSAV